MQRALPVRANISFVHRFAAPRWYHLSLKMFVPGGKLLNSILSRLAPISLPDFCHSYPAVAGAGGAELLGAGM